MADNHWSNVELAAATRAYLWMLKCKEKDLLPSDTRVRAALLENPLRNISEAQLSHCFGSISAVLQRRGRVFNNEYTPEPSVELSIERRLTGIIADYDRERDKRRMLWMVKALPEEVVCEAADKLVDGLELDYHESTKYVVRYRWESLPPKKVIGLAGKLYFNCVLHGDHFDGGLGTVCFKKLEESGLVIVTKTNAATIAEPESDGFRKEVEAFKKREDNIDIGSDSPRYRETSTRQLERDLRVVSTVEKRANGICELCGKEAPFKRPDGTSYLEVHHIKPLAEGGADRVGNAVALCPNCHRECHYGGMREALFEKLISVVQRYTEE